MKIYIGSDHGGFTLKSQLIDYLGQHFPAYVVEDCGTDSSDSVDYPIFGKMVAQQVVSDPTSLGIIVCGSGIGISIAANKIKGARAALCNSVELATLARQHNGANILAMGERTKFIDEPTAIVKTFLETSIDLSERHERRRALLDSL